MDRSHELKKFHDKQIPFLGSNGFRLDLRPYKVYFFELSVKFYFKSSPKTLKLLNISRGSEKGAKSSYGRYPTEFVFEVKNEKYLQLDQFHQ
jgi:hypothetical protein